MADESNPLNATSFSVDTFVGQWRKTSQWRLLLLAPVIGVVVGLLSVGFIHAIDLAQQLWLGVSGEFLASGLEKQPFWRRVIGPVAGGLTVGLLLMLFFPGQPRPPGIAQVIEASALRGGAMNFATGIKGAILNALSIGAGASVGREGPMVHLGATFGTAIAELFRLERTPRRILLASAVAAAIAASFNAPLAGVFFALEVVVGSFALHAFGPAVLAALTATLVSRAIMGDQQVFVIPDQVIAHVLEFPAFLILGALCGVVAFLFTRATIRLARFADNMPVPRFALPAMAGIAVAVTGLWMPEALGVGYEATSEALAGNYALDFLIGLLVVKFALSALSQAFGFGGGVFSTSLVIGAAFGTAFGIIAISVSPVESSASTVYTIVGMGSLAAAVMGSPISTILMMFEMTSSYEVTIAVMLGAITSTAMFHLLGSGSFFNAQLKRLGLEIKGGQDVSILRDICITSVWDQEIEVVQASSPATSLLDRLLANRWGRLFVADSDGRLVGKITTSVDRAKFADDTLTAVDLMVKTSSLPQTACLSEAMDLLRAKGDSHVPIVDNEDNQRPIALLHDFDLTYAYHRALLAVEGKAVQVMGPEWDQRK